MYLCVRAPRRSPLMCSSLLLQQYPACLTWMVCEMGCKWPYSCYVASRICSKQRVVFLFIFHLVFSLFVSIAYWGCIHIVALTQSMLLYICTPNMLCFILSERSDLHIIDNLSIVVHAVAIRKLTLLSVDEIWLLRYVRWFTNFRGLSLKVEMAPSCFKKVNFYFRLYRTFAFCCLFKAIQIRLGQGYFIKALNYLRSLG